MSSTDRDIRVFANNEERTGAVREYILSCIHEALDARNVCSIALSGGTTPLSLYASLSNATLDWSRIHVFLVDERFVSTDSADSNEKMIRQTLISNITIPTENFHLLYTTGTLENMAYEASHDIQAFFGNKPSFDIILLGMGDDGHTASLFEIPNMHNTHTIVVPIHNSPKPPSERLSLSYTTINNAAHIIFLVSGSSKSVPFHSVQNNDTTLPATHIRPLNGDMVWFIDKEVAV